MLGVRRRYLKRRTRLQTYVLCSRSFAGVALKTVECLEVLVRRLSGGTQVDHSRRQNEGKSHHDDFYG